MCVGGGGMVIRALADGVQVAVLFQDHRQIPRWITSLTRSWDMPKLKALQSNVKHLFNIVVQHESITLSNRNR